MTQLALFDSPLPRAGARRTDPQSSKDAAARVEQSGKADSQRAIVLEALRKWNASTSRELSEYAHLDRYLVARRLPDLLKRGLVGVVHWKRRRAENANV